MLGLCSCFTVLYRLMSNKHPTTDLSRSSTDETSAVPTGRNLLSPDRRGFLRRLAGVGGLAAAGAWPSFSHAEGFAQAMGYKPAYAADFSHFDYVNADAPREGSLTLSVFGTFDSLNPFVLKR